MEIKLCQTDAVPLAVSRLPMMADVNNNTRKRGRPKGSRNKNKGPQQAIIFNSTQNHTLESLRDKKKRTLSQIDQQVTEISDPSSNTPSKKPTSSPVSESLGDTRSHDLSIGTATNITAASLSVPPTPQTPPASHQLSLQVALAQHWPMMQALSCSSWLTDFLIGLSHPYLMWKTDFLS